MEERSLLGLRSYNLLSTYHPVHHEMSSELVVNLLSSLQTPNVTAYPVPSVCTYTCQLQYNTLYTLKQLTCQFQLAAVRNPQLVLTCSYHHHKT